jgi:excisionase family DNA binding protein
MPFHPHQPPHARRPHPDTDPRPSGHTPSAPIEGPLLYTPAEAADLLKVRESWLRRKAAARQVPCTFLGRHLRFSPSNLAAIVAAAAQPPHPHRRRAHSPRPGGSDLIDGPKRSVDAPRPDDHNHPDGSTTWPG